MKKTSLLSRKSASADIDESAVILTEKLIAGASDWLCDCEYSNISPTTCAKYQTMADNLVWFLQDRKYARCGKDELKEFIYYVQEGHEDKRGRWGNPRNCKPTRPSTITTYFTVVRTLFRFLVREGYLAVSPMEKLRRPKFSQDQIQPFTQEQVEQLRSAAKTTHHPRRDEAILLLLLDTGIRASELCNLKMRDVDLSTKRCRIVHGKGNKARTVFFGKDCGRALWHYLREDGEREDDSPVFVSDRGTDAGNALTRWGLSQLMQRLGKSAKMKGVRCSPHTLRHTFATEFLRGGGNVFTLKELLGHTSLTICNRYVTLAAADLEHQHRQYSPVDRLRKKKQHV